MKASFIAIAAAFVFSQEATAQKFLDWRDDASGGVIVIPKEFSYDRTPMLTLYNWENQELSVYDENLDLVKTVNLNGGMTSNFQLTYKYEERDVDIQETNKRVVGTYSSMEQAFNAYCYFGQYNESKAIIKVQDNGDELITYDPTDYYIQNSDSLYLSYSTLGVSYPKIYWIRSQGSVSCYKVDYIVTYSDWRDAGTRVVNKQKSQELFKLENINLNIHESASRGISFIVSQTLFNEDEEYEYIVPKYKLSTVGQDIDGLTPSYPNPNEVVTTRYTCISEENKLALAGFQVISSSGNVVGDVTFDTAINYFSSYGAYVITIGNFTYLGFSGSFEENESGTIFYKIDRATTNIQQVKQVPASMLLSPTVVERNATIDIRFGDDNRDGSQIVISSSAGGTVKTQMVPSGQQASQMSVTAPAGLYCVSRVQKNKVIDTRKIILK
ncbi:MAG: hypothetical protein ACI3YX_01810 [Prevotella sp.]